MDRPRLCYSLCQWLDGAVVVCTGTLCHNLLDNRNCLCIDQHRSVEVVADVLVEPQLAPHLGRLL